MHMLRSLILAAAALLLSSPVDACTCLPPPPLSDCELREDQAALLVTMKCVKSLICDINTGVAVVDVLIDKVFQDNTGLGLQVGDMATVSSLTSSATCGIGLSFAPGAQWILFANPGPPSEANTGGRRLQQSVAVVKAEAVDINGEQSVDVVANADIDSVFSDGSVCDVSDADLETNLCAGNVIEPTDAQIMELMKGCSTP